MRIFDNKIYSELPQFLQDVCGHGVANEERDLLLLGSLASLSAVLPNVVGEYGDERLYANLYLYVTAQASAGKGKLSLCRRLVGPVHEALLRNYKKEMALYKAARAEYLVNKGDLEKPIEPAKQMLLIPANSSATAVFQILSENDGVGLIFETEGDTLAKAFRSGCGDYSDGFRKAFHHERVSYMRRKDKEHVDLLSPRLSVLLTGTPQQVLGLIPDAENGLFSRFMYYYMDVRLDWNNVFVKRERSLDLLFDEYGAHFYDFYRLLKKGKERHFSLSESQQAQFNTQFGLWQDEYRELCGVGFVANVRRMGVICFRIAMLLTSLRLMNCIVDWEDELVCSDVDFEIAMKIVDVLLEHSEVVYKMLPKSKIQAGNLKSSRERQSMQLLEKLDEQFSTQDLLHYGKELGMTKRTVLRRLESLLESNHVVRIGHGTYAIKNKG